MDYFFKKALTSLNQDIGLGFANVPTLQSKFYSEEEFDIFKLKYHLIVVYMIYLHIAGHFNAQMFYFDDFTENDAFLSDHFNIDTKTIISFLYQNNTNGKS